MNLFSFKGRLRRTVYILVVFIYVALMFVFMLRFMTLGYHNDPGIFTTLLIFPALWILTSLSVQRIHDIGYSGWWQLLICAFPFLVLGLITIKGQDGSNCYGKDPRNVENMSSLNNLLVKFIQLLLYIIICILVIVLAYICFAIFLEWFRQHSKFWFVVLTIFFGSVLPYLCTMFASLLLTLLSYISPLKWIGAISISILALSSGIFLGYWFWSNAKVSSGWEIFATIAITFLLLESTFSIIMGSMDGLLFLSRFDKPKIK